MLFRATNIFMTVFFLFATAVQYNDPDPIRWMLVYGLAAFACIKALRVRIFWVFPALLGAAALIWAGSLAPRVIGKTTLKEIFGSMRMVNPTAEEAREMLGLLIVALWMALLSWRGLNRQDPKLSSSDQTEDRGA